MQTTKEKKKLMSTLAEMQDLNYIHITKPLSSLRVVYHISQSMIRFICGENK